MQNSDICSYQLVYCDLCFLSHYLYNQALVLFVITGVDECLNNNGNCSHDCVNTEVSYYCECPTGYILQTNKYDCEGK